MVRVALALLALATTTAAAADPWLDQEPPGRTAVPLAPGILAPGDEYAMAGDFTPDGTGFVFTRRTNFDAFDNRLYETHLTSDGWTEPAMASFAQDVFEFESHISPDGRYVYFASQRPGCGTGGGFEGIWWSERSEGGWSEPTCIDAPFNERFVMYVTSTVDRTLYFTGPRGLFRSRFVDGSYLESERLPDAVNMDPSACHPGIAPDESYILFEANREGRNTGEIMVSFRSADDTWTPAVPLGPGVNTDAHEWGARVSADGRFVLFNRDGVEPAGIYWVDAGVVEELRPN